MVTVIGTDLEGGAMRVNKWGVGVVLAAAVMLTGCSAGASDKPAESKPSGAASQEAEAMTDTAGYAAKTVVMGMESTTRFNPAEKALESLSPMGSIVAIGDDVWVKSPSSDWQAADPSSSDPIIAGLSTTAKDVTAMDPAETAKAITGDFTVTGTGERLGQKVYLVSGTVEQAGTPVEVVFEVTEDYVNLASTSSATVQGQSVDVALEITEWDVKQDIVAPL